MNKRKITDGVYMMGAVDWDRRLFDSLIPLPDGTSYNSYLIRGSERTALIDTVDPELVELLKGQLSDVERVDYMIANHAEQDHSGSIPFVLEKYPDAKLISSPKGKGMLVDHLHVPEERCVTVEDGETLSLGDKTLQFVHTPWVHWPETMSTYLQDDGILFSCDFFGSHLATTDMFVRDDGLVYEAAKRYYAEIMMPFRTIIKKNIEKLGGYDIRMIGPSHGPMYDKPAFIVYAYKDWISDTPKNEVVIPFISMHGSTEAMVTHLTAAFADRGVKVHRFDLSVTDLGKLAISLVDAATLIIGTPTVHVGPHPAVHNAAHLANALRPKLKLASIVGSYGWKSNACAQIQGLIPNLKVEILDPVLCMGLPREDDLKALDGLVDAVVEKHRGLGIA